MRGSGGNVETLLRCSWCSCLIEARVTDTLFLHLTVENINFWNSSSLIMFNKT